MHLSIVDWTSGKDIVALPEHRGIRCLAFSGDGQRVATVDSARLNRYQHHDACALVVDLSSFAPRL